MRQQDFNQAATFLERACALDGSSFQRWMKLVAVRRAAGDPKRANAALSRALSLQPLDFTALLLRASLLESEGAPEDSIGEAYQRALFRLPPSNVSLPPAMQSTIARARILSDAYVARQNVRIRAAADEIRPAHTGDPRVSTRIERFATNIIRKTRSYAPEPTMFDYPGLRLVEFTDREDLPFIADIEAATDTIEQEFHAVLAANTQAKMPYINYRDDLPLAQWVELNRSDRWSAIHLIRNGTIVEEAARHCPETMRLFAGSDQPDVPGMSPNLMFSLLAPHTHIPPHTGVSNTRIIFHLPLIVPPHCRFRVGSETREWHRGEAFAFDDTVEHEAWNDSDELRVVLIGDMWRPELSADERALASAMMVAAGVASAEM